MTKAEERALEKYPAYKSVFDKYEKQRYAYICGYIQAEKDNELTWEDMEAIQKIANNYTKYHSMESRFFVYKEVLKRFKERKEKCQ